MKQQQGYTRTLLLIMILGVGIVIAAIIFPKVIYNDFDKFTSGKSTSSTYSRE